MDPLQTNCHITFDRFNSWIDQGLKGQLFIQVNHKGQKAEIYKGSYFVNGELMNLSPDKIKEVFWGLMYKFKRIRIEGHQYLLKERDEELWDKYPA